MEISRLVPRAVMDSDSERDTIYFLNADEAGLFYIKTRVDQDGQAEAEPSQMMSLWYALLDTSQVTEIISFGQDKIDCCFSILTPDFFYFARTAPSEGSESEEIWRVIRQTLVAERCFGMGSYFLHGMEAADERYVVVQTEDRVPGLEEIIVVDLVLGKMAVLTDGMSPPQSFYSQFLTDRQGRISWFVWKRWVGRHEMSSSENRLFCCSLEELLGQLEWRAFEKDLGLDPCSAPSF